MKKTGLKTFFISFLFSLFAIFVANGLFLRAQSAAKPKDLIPSKNIVLFLKQEPEQIRAAQIIPLKKISLSIPSKKVDIAQEDVWVEPELAQDFAEEKPENIVVSEIVEPLSQELTDPIKPHLADDLADKIIEDFDDFIKKPVVVASADSLPVEKESVATLNEAPVVEQEIKIPLEKEGFYEADIKLELVDSSKGSAQVAFADSNGFGHLDEPRQLESEPVPGIIVETESSDWVEMKEAAPKADAAWTTAKGVKYPKNKMVLEQDSAIDKTDVKLASETVKNILIPIPDDITAEGDFMPQIKSESKPQEIVDEAPAPVSNYKAEAESTKSSTILDNLGSIFSQTSKNVGAKIEEQISSISQKAKDVKKSSNKPSTIMPTEIRLAFAPNRAEISGQTVKWLNAFAQKAQEDGIGLEIRIDGTSAQDLQQKRLNLIYNILSSKGVNAEKVDTIFTSREPNSFIIRTIKKRPDFNDNINQTPSYQQW